MRQRLPQRSPWHPPPRPHDGHPPPVKATPTMRAIEELPEEVQPSAEAITRDKELAARQQAILAEVAQDSGNRIKVSTPRKESIQYGPNGEIVAHTVNGVSQLSREEQAIRKAQATHNAQLVRMQEEHKRLVAQRDTLRGYDPKGKPLYVHSEAERERLTRLARGLEFSMVGQARLSDRAWRKEAAPAIRQAKQDRITAAELEQELRAKGRVQYASGPRNW